MLQVVGHGRVAAEQIIAVARSYSNLVCRPLKSATPTSGQDDREATDKASDWLSVTTVIALSILDANQGKWAYISKYS